MKHLKNIFLWLALATVLALIIKYYNPDIKGIGLYIIIMSIGLSIGIVNAFLSYYGSKARNNIFDEAVEIFDGKVNINGETELTIKGKRIVLDYQLEYAGKSAGEYIIAYIDLSGFDASQIKKCKKEFEIITENNKFYAVVYSSWGYKGEKFKERIESKIDFINECL